MLTILFTFKPTDGLMIPVVALATSGVSLCCHGWTWGHRLSKRGIIKESEEIFWIVIIQKEEKNTHWVLTDANASHIVWSEWLWVKNTYVCDSVFIFLNVCAWHWLQGTETHSGALTDMNSSALRVSLHQAFTPVYTCLFTSATEFLGGGAVKSSTGTSCDSSRSLLHVCSESSGTPLGKMRGLITVKLANEQVNYRAQIPV